VWIAFLLGTLSVSACGKRSSETKEDQNLLGLTLGPVLADTSLTHLLPESSAVGVGDYDLAHKAAGRDQFWLVDYTWFFLPHRPLEFKTFAEMHKMEEAGEIDTSTVVSTITYRYGMEAEDIERLRKRAVELRPKIPPAVLTKVVNEYVATHRISSKASWDTLRTTSP
jgi:hypothetical protein